MVKWERDMAGLGALWDPNLHPRGFHGRFIKKFKLAPWLDHVLKSFAPRQFQTDSQAAQFNFNAAHASPGGAFSELELRRVRTDWDEASDHMRAGQIDPTTKAFMDTMDRHMAPTKEGLILGRTFGPEALGLTPQQLNESDPNGITRMMGNTITDKAYSPMHLGSDMSHGPGKITMRVAVPPGVRVAHLGENRNDRGVAIDKEQKLLVTRVYPDGQGGWYMTAVAEPPNATTGTPTELVQGRKGANLTPAQREARIGGPSVMPQPAEPPSAPAQQVNIAGKESVLPGPPQEQTPARAAAREARRAGYQQARANEGQPPSAPQPQAVAPTPSPAPPAGVGQRTEPVHGPIGGVPTEGKSASEIANTPAGAPPAPVALAPTPQASAASFKQEFQGRGLQSPTAGPQRKEFNNAYLGVTSGKKDPADALRELDADIEKNKTLLAGPEGKVPHEELQANITKQEKLANLIAEHFNAPRAHKPEIAPAPAKKGFTSVKELTPSERSAYDSLDQSGRSKYLARRRAGQDHASALTGAKGEKAPAKAVEKAVPAPAKAGVPRTFQTEKNAAAAARRAETGQQKPTVNPVNMKPGDKVLVRKNDAGEWVRTTTKTGATPLTVDRVETGAMASKGGRTRRAYILHGTGPNGEKIQTVAHAGNTAFKRHEEKAPVKAAEKVAKAVPEKVAKAAPAKVAKVAKAAPAAKAVSEVQTRADAAGLPTTVTALRQAAREKKIRGFSTMNKEQLQRALLGEEVNASGKVGAIAPDKLTPHIREATSGQAANALLEEHTVADLKALAKHNGIDLKGITTKDRIKEAILQDIRGPEGGTLRPEKPLTSLSEDIRGVKVPGDAKSIVDGVNPDDPESLRSASDQLETMAKAADNPTDAGRLQKLSDAMGMRAQVISGVEAQAPTKKVTKAAAKAAPTKKLSVHQERIRKQHIADGMSEAEARRLAEEAPVRAPAGTKAATAKRIAAKKAAALPGPREEGAPGPKLTAPRKAATPGPVVAREGLAPSGETGPAVGTPARAAKARELKLAREGLVPSGETGPQITRGRTQAEILQQSKLGGAQLAPDAAEIKRILREQTDTPISRAEADGLLRGLTKAQLMDQADGLNIPRARTLTKDNLRREIVDATVGRKIDSQASRGFIEARPGSINEPPTPEQIATQARLQPAKATKEAVAKAEKAHPEAPPAAVKATRAKVAKDIPDGSVGTRGSEPIDNSARFNEFQQGWNKAMNKVPIPDKTSQGSLDEIHKDVASGKITPEEGIRRLESDISLNQDEITDINRTIRAGGLSEAETNDLRTKRDKLITSVAGQETASRYMHEHFGKERVTVPEVQGKIIDAQGQKWWDNLNKEDPEEFRRILKEETGLDAKGSNAQEIFQDALKQTIKGELDKRAAAKEARNAQKAAREAAKAKAVEEFSPGGAKHLDAKAIAGDLNIEQRHIDAAQGDLNQGMSPAKAAQNIRDRAQRMSDANAIINGGVDSSRISPEHKAELDQKYRAGAEEVANLRQLADKVAEAKRPRVTRTPAKAAAEDLAKAKEAVKEPAAKKAVTRAEAAVKASGEEAAALKARILDRHQKAWDSATTRAEAEQAATNMRQDLLLSEIRDWAKPQGITGRSKEDILKKALDRRFNAANLPPEQKIRAVNDRMARGQRASNVAQLLSDVEELNRNGASERAIRSRVQSRVALAKRDQGNVPEDLASRLEEAAVSKNQAELDQIAQEFGLTRNTADIGSVEPFDPVRHASMGNENLRKGQAVTIHSPGYAGVTDGRNFQAKRAGVLAASPEENQAMLERLGRQRREEIANLPAETRAAVLGRLQRQRENNAAVRAAKKAPAKVAVPELTTNKQEEVAANMARLNAAKAVKAAPATKTLPHRQTPKQIIEQLKTATTVEEGNKILSTLPQSKAQYRAMANEVGIEVAAKDTMAQMHDKILRRTVTTRLEHGAYVRLGGGAPSEVTKTAVAATREARAAKKAAPSAGEGAATLAKGGFNEPFIRAEVTPPRNADAALARERSVPVKRAHVSFNESTSPATFNRESDLRAPNGSWSSDQGLIHMDSEIGQLWQDLAKDNRVPTTDLNKITVVGQELARGDISLNEANARLNAIRNGLPEGAVKNRFTSALSDLSGPKKPDVSVPDNTPQSVKDWLEKVADTPTFNKARPGHDKTPFEELQDLVKEVSEGKRPLGAESKLGAIGNVHESTDGYYALRRDAGKVFSTPEARKWFMTRPGAEPAKATPAPAKAAKKTAKAAPTVTKAELRNPVAKVGAEAPKAPEANVTAHGLTPGEGVPVSNFLALQNKLGSGRSGDLRTLDRYARVPGDYNKIPDLYRRVLQQLQQAGVGPDDPVRKAFEKWFKDHFS
jgi:hypothetical protein